MDGGRVEEINIGPERTLPAPVERVRALAGKGLEGNRYFFPDGAAPGTALTLIAAEALEGMTAEHGIEITAAESRRNVLTRGIDLNALVGKRFRVGEVECLGIELCEPCRHLESVTKPGVIKGLVHRGGLNADILSDGQIAVGDPVVLAEG
jgi:MOSC domain-containing protein YiiM